jgi:REP element-mobilizing transposase RayT
MFHLAPPPSFRGFDESGPFRAYYRHLPHWRQEGVTYFVTARLSDSLPKGRVQELISIRKQWATRYAQPRNKQQWEELLELLTQRLDDWLDQGSGSCILASSENSQLVAKAFHHFDGQRYELGAYVIMPNHFHLLIRPFSDAIHPLENILQSWKSYTSRRIVWPDTCRDRLWQRESFDRIVRDEEHLFKSLQYIGSNPASRDRERLYPLGQSHMASLRLGLRVSRQRRAKLQQK